MNYFQSLLFSLKKLLRPSKVSHELDEEMKSHFEMSIENKMASGMSRREAERTARLDFGSPLRMKEACRMSWGSRVMEEIWQDISYASRRLLKHKGYSIPIVIILSLSMGVSAAFFCVLQLRSLNPVSYPESEKVLQIYYEIDSSGGQPRRRINLPALIYDRIEKLTDSFSAIGLTTFQYFYLYDREAIKSFRVQKGTPSVWRVFGVTPIYGRVFDEEDLKTGNHLLAVISYELAKDLFKEPQLAIGDRMRLDDQYYEVIGVLPKDFRDGVNRPRAIWIPYKVTPEMVAERSFWSHTGHAYCRLDAETSLEQFRAKLEVVQANLCGDNQFYKSYAERLNQTITTYPVSDKQSRTKLDMGMLTIVLFTLSFLLFLIGCLNTTSLILADLMKRFQEILTFSALGASSRRINQQLMLESAMLLFLSGSLAVFIANASMQWVAYSLQPDQATWGITVLYIFGLIIFGLFLISLIVLRKTRRRRLEALLREHQSSISFNSNTLRIFLGTQCLLTVVLILVTGFLSINVSRILNLNFGFEPKNRVVVDLQFPKWKYENTPEQQKTEANLILNRLSEIKGVANACLTVVPPQSNTTGRTTGAFRREEIGLESLADETNNFISFTYRDVSRSFFEVMDIPWLAKGWPESKATDTITQEIVVEQRFVNDLLNERNPIGIIFSGTRGTQFKIVGVVGNVEFDSNQSNYQGRQSYNFFTPFDHGKSYAGPHNACVSLILNHQKGSKLDQNAIVSVIRNIDEDLAMGVNPYEELIRTKYKYLIHPRNTAIYLGIFSFFLTLYGFYSYLSYYFHIQRKELAIRLYLGSKTASLMGKTLLRNVPPVMGGVLTGSLIVYFLIQRNAEQFTEINQNDPWPYLIAIGAMFLVLLISMIMPFYSLKSMSLREVLTTD